MPNQIQERSKWKDVEFKFDLKKYGASCPTPGGKAGTASTTFWVRRVKRTIPDIRQYDYEVRMEGQFLRLAAVTGEKGGICKIGHVTNKARDGNCGFLEAAVRSCILDQKRKGGFDPVKNKVKWINHSTNKPLAKEAKKNCITIIKLHLQSMANDDTGVMDMVDKAAHTMAVIKEFNAERLLFEHKPWKIIVQAPLHTGLIWTLIQTSDKFSELFIPLNGKKPRELKRPEVNYDELFDFIGYDFFLCECQPADGRYCKTMHRGSDDTMEGKILQMKRKLGLPSIPPNQHL